MNSVPSAGLHLHTYTSLFLHPLCCLSLSWYHTQVSSMVWQLGQSLIHRPVDISEIVSRKNRGEELNVDKRVFPLVDSPSELTSKPLSLQVFWECPLCWQFPSLIPHPFAELTHLSQHSFTWLTKNPNNTGSFLTLNP